MACCLSEAKRAVLPGSARHSFFPTGQRMVRMRTSVRRASGNCFCRLQYRTSVTSSWASPGARVHGQAPRGQEWIPVKVRGVFFRAGAVWTVGRRSAGQVARFRSPGREVGRRYAVSRFKLARLSGMLYPRSDPEGRPLAGPLAGAGVWRDGGQVAWVSHPPGLSSPLPVARCPFRRRRARFGL